MKNLWTVWVVALILSVLIVGCSGHGSPAEPPVPGEITSYQQNTPNDSASSHYLWGYYTFVVDTVAGEMEVIPRRDFEFHANVLKFLEQGASYLGIDNLEINFDSVDVDVKLTHPFPGLDMYTGFDVKGILILPGKVEGQYDSGFQVDLTTTLELEDGFSKTWNPSDFPKIPPIFGYQDGKLGNKYDGLNLGATLNPYKYFCDDLDEYDSLESLNPDHRGMFRTGHTNVRHYRITFPPTEGLVFNYAVDASWEPPDPNPPIAIPGDFAMNANAPEAYRVDPRIISNDLFYFDAGNRGGSAEIEIDVYDWQGCDDTLVKIYKPNTWNDETMVQAGGTEHYSTYAFEVPGDDLESSDEFNLLIGAFSLDATYEHGDIADENIATYKFLTLPVSASGYPPEVISIDPDNGDIDTLVEDVEITGANFAPDATVVLIDDGTGGIEIDGSNVVVNGPDSITCDFDLTGVGIIPGKYDVRVTNPGTGLDGELDKGFTVNDTAHPWPSWRGGDLNQAASKTVGYGDSSASGTPKWSVTAVEQGNAGCVVANDGTIYFTVRNCALYAVNPDGSEKWHIAPQTPWISLCPAIDDEGYVYCCMGTPSVNYLHKVDPVDGSLEWSCYLGGTPCYATAPAIGHDGAVYIAYSTAYDSGYIQRINPDGTPGWNYWIPSSAYSYSWELGCAILDNGNIIATGGTHGRIICFEPDGDIVWTYQHTNWILHTPSVGPEGNIYFTTWSAGDLVALDQNGNYLWEVESGFYNWSSPAVDPETGNIFWGDRLGHFRCVDPDGDVLWDHVFASTGIDGSAAVDGNGDVYVAVGHQPSAPYVGVVKMDGDDGTILWQSDNLGYLVTHSPSIGADGTIYMTGHYASSALMAWGE